MIRKHIRVTKDSDIHLADILPRIRIDGADGVAASTVAPRAACAGSGAVSAATAAMFNNLPCVFSMPRSVYRRAVTKHTGRDVEQQRSCGGGGGEGGGGGGGGGGEGEVPRSGGVEVVGGGDRRWKSVRGSRREPRASSEQSRR
ncbi:hypothetical protein V1478_014846 [Vespula squamosa]|uniref:Uncharacterized protein n=1 Tax=Vespula squamosa TaxID=30214 RepID=A0ABD2A3G7_VESSQ